MDFDPKLIYDSIPDLYYNELSGADKKLLERFWRALYETLITMEYKLERTENLLGLESNLNTFHNPARWIKFTFNGDNLVSGNTYTIDSTIISIDQLQDKIIDPAQTITNHVISGNQITFTSTPPETLWGKLVMIDDTQVETQFGKLINFTRNSTDPEKYVKQLMVLYNSYYQGCSISSLKSGLATLLDLPISFNDDGETVWQIANDKIYIKDKTYDIPSGLSADVAVGDAIDRFQILTSGITILDYIIDDDWWTTYGVTLNPEEEKFSFGILFDKDIDIDVNSPPADISYFLKRITNADLKYHLIKES